MIRMFSLKNFFAPLMIGALALAGCGDDDDDSEATATPEPAMDDYFRVTSMEIGDSNTGVDLDGDGTVDNNIEETLIQVSAALSIAIETALIDAGVEECQTPPTQEVCIDTVMDVVNQVLATVFDVDQLSDAVNQPISEGQINYLTEFKETGANVDLVWWTGAFVDVGWDTVSTLGTQSGSLDTSGYGEFGPGDLTLRFYFEIQDPQTGETEVKEIPITLYDGITIVSGYNQQSISDMLVGGAISLEDLLGLVEQVLISVNDALTNLPTDVDPLPVDEIVDTLAEAIAPFADINLDSDEEYEGFSIGLEASASHIELLE